MNTCLFCSKQFSNAGGKATHEPYCKFNPDKKTRSKSPTAHRKKGSIAWNKGLTKDTVPSLARPNQIGKKFGSSLTGHTSDTKAKLAEIAKDRGIGGYIEGSGQGIKGWYNGIFCDSSWELAYVIYCADHNMTIHRCYEKRSYLWGGVSRNYLPDFIVDGKIVEVKGFETPQWLAKLAANPDIEVVDKEKIKCILEYVINRYGKDFTKLYQK